MQPDGTHDGHQLAALNSSSYRNANAWRAASRYFLHCYEPKHQIYRAKKDADVLSGPLNTHKLDVTFAKRVSEEHHLEDATHVHCNFVNHLIDFGELAMRI